MKINIWDKQSPIKNITVEELVSYRSDIKSAIESGEEVILVSNDLDIVEEIAFELDVRNKLSVDMSIDINDICTMYLDYVNKRDNSQNNQHDNLLAKIDILESEKERLSIAIKEQDDLLVNATYRIAELEKTSEVIENV